MTCRGKPLGYFDLPYLLFVTYFFLYIHLLKVTGVFKPPGIVGVSKPPGIAGVFKPPRITRAIKPPGIAEVLNCRE